MLNQPLTFYRLTLEVKHWDSFDTAHTEEIDIGAHFLMCLSYLNNFKTYFVSKIETLAMQKSEVVYQARLFKSTKSNCSINLFSRKGASFWPAGERRLRGGGGGSLLRQCQVRRAKKILLSDFLRKNFACVCYNFAYPKSWVSLIRLDTSERPSLRALSGQACRHTLIEFSSAAL